MTAWEWRELIALQKVKDTLTEKICDDTDVVAKVECVPKVYTLVPIVLVVRCQGGKDS